MSPDSTLIFVDGENLAFRYKEMLAFGRVPRPDNVYIEDCFIWNQGIFDKNLWKIKRLAYYTSVIGDDDRVRKVREIISAITFTCTIDKTIRRKGQIVPFIRKKIARSRKESICDIAIAVDVMRACYRDHAETIWLFSGDGDFVQLAEEAVHSGKCVYVSALSSGLNDELRYVVDEFIPLDDYFFLTDEEIFAAKAAVAATTAAVTDANAETQNPQESQASGA